MLVGGTARVYNSRAQALNILKRDAHATPVLDVLSLGAHQLLGEREARGHIVLGKAEGLAAKLAGAFLGQRRRGLAGSERVARIRDPADGPHDRAGDHE